MMDRNESAIGRTITALKVGGPTLLSFIEQTSDATKNNNLRPI